MSKIKEEAPVFVGMAVIYSYLKKKSEEFEADGLTRLVLGRELTPEEIQTLPQDLKELIRAHGGFRCFQVLAEKE